MGRDINNFNVIYIFDMGQDGWDEWLNNLYFCNDYVIY